jgi:protein TonB
MITMRRCGCLGICLLASVLIHAAFILLPARVFEPLLSYRATPGASPPKDLTPDFAEIAMTVIGTDQVTMPVPTETRAPPSPAADRGSDLGPISQPAAPSTDETGGAPETETGPGPAPDTEAALFPPLPRLIVPPRLENLDAGTMTINLRILVGRSGEPEMVVVNDTLDNQEIRAAILESARRFRFEPARRGNEPVSAWIDIPIILEASDGR